MFLSFLTSDGGAEIKSVVFCPWKRAWLFGAYPSAKADGWEVARESWPEGNGIFKFVASTDRGLVSVLPGIGVSAAESSVVGIVETVWNSSFIRTLP